MCVKPVIDTGRAKGRQHHYSLQPVQREGMSGDLVTTSNGENAGKKEIRSLGTNRSAERAEKREWGKLRRNVRGERRDRSKAVGANEV